MTVRPLSLLRLPLRGVRTQMSCLRMFLSIFCSVTDQRRVFGIVDALEHALECVVHGRPGAAELGAAFVGQENLAHAAVGLALLAPHQTLRLQRVERAADSVDCSMTV